MNKAHIELRFFFILMLCLLLGRNAAVKSSSYSAIQIPQGAQLYWFYCEQNEEYPKHMVAYMLCVFQKRMWE